MGWPAPSQRERETTGSDSPNEKERSDEDCYAWHRPWQECLQLGGPRRDGGGRSPAKDETRVGVAVHRAAGKLHGVDGGALWGTPSWPATHTPRTRCPFDVPRVSATLC